MCDSAAVKQRSVGYDPHHCDTYYYDLFGGVGLGGKKLILKRSQIRIRTSKSKLYSSQPEINVVVRLTSYIKAQP